MPRKKKAPPAAPPAADPGPVPVPFTPILAVCADVHLGNHPRWGGPLVDGLNRRGRETVAALTRAVRAAEAAGCSAFAVAGDLFHTRRPEPALIAAVQRVFSSTLMAVILCPGNHDALDASAAGGNTAMAPLWKDATVVTESSWFQLQSVSLLVVPFDGRKPMAEWLEAELERTERPGTDGERRILLTHVGVFDEEGAAPWQLRARDGIGLSRLRDLLIAHRFHGCFVGNYHNNETWLASPIGSVVQVGTLCPASFSDPEPRTGRIYLTDGANVRHQEIPGPRFLTARYDTLRGVELQADGCTFYVRQVGGPEALTPKEGGNVVAVDWVPEQDVVAGAAPGSISQTPEEALRAACAEVPRELAADVEELVMTAWSRGA